MVIVEAFSLGVPVIAARIGALQELVSDGNTGLLFDPGDASDLAAKVEWLWDHPRDAERMGKNARLEYEGKFTPEHNYEMLMNIYQTAMASKK